jgi:hypothetical protein
MVDLQTFSLQLPDGIGRYLRVLGEIVRLQDAPDVSHRMACDGGISMWVAPLFAILVTAVPLKSALSL